MTNKTPEKPTAKHPIPRRWTWEEWADREYNGAFDAFNANAPYIDHLEAELLILREQKKNNVVNGFEWSMEEIEKLEEERDRYKNLYLELTDAVPSLKTKRDKYQERIEELREAFDVVVEALKKIETHWNGCDCCDENHLIMVKAGNHEAVKRVLKEGE